MGLEINRWGANSDQFLWYVREFVFILSNMVRKGFALRAVTLAPNPLVNSVNAPGGTIFCKFLKICCRSESERSAHACEVLPISSTLFSSQYWKESVGLLDVSCQRVTIGSEVSVENVKSSISFKD